MKQEDMLKATLVSLCPFEINEVKPGLIPNIYKLPASDEVTPRVCVVGPGRYDVYIDSDRGFLPIPVPAHSIAASVVMDFLVAQLGYSSDCHPALFFVVGVYTAAEVAKEFQAEIKAALRAQSQWYEQLVTVADDDWEKIRQHTAISDTQRFAARKLGLKRDWLIEASEVPTAAEIATKRCPGCGAPAGDVVVCPTCRCILDPIRYATLKFAQG